MTLSPGQERRLALVNDLITADPEAATRLADRLAELIQLDAARLADTRPHRRRHWRHGQFPPDTGACTSGGSAHV